ncbi:hypothetical protein C5E11_03825 [Clavibacter michiganensis]|nr:hypothetical protein [Clavibacter michiganensis]PPF64530.1 hypothetical protein C5E11_03825 [Clavibacter michiganensis]
MSWFRKKAVPDTEDLLEAQMAIDRANRSIEITESRDSEVTQISLQLEARKHRNNFGEALEKAMTRRATE